MALFEKRKRELCLIGLTGNKKTRKAREVNNVVESMKSVNKERVRRPFSKSGKQENKKSS